MKEIFKNMNCKYLVIQYSSMFLQEVLEMPQHQLAENHQDHEEIQLTTMLRSYV